MPKHQLESFSDGVFAIVITLLILNVHLDRDQGTDLADAHQPWAGCARLCAHFRDCRRLLGLAPQHGMIKAVDRRLLWLNLLLLLAVVFIPFPAYLLGR